MISSDQPTIFRNKVIVGVSSIADGNMKKTHLPEDQQVIVDDNRKQFLSHNGITLDQTILVSLSYAKEDFAVYDTVGEAEAGQGMTTATAAVSDALATKDKNVALFLPIADCCPVVFYNAQKEVLMLSHLGRHSIEQEGTAKSIQYLLESFDSKPQDTLVWLGPAAGSKNYPLFSRNNRSMHEVIIEQLLSAGVQQENIELSAVDTTVDTNYFSHSQFTKGNREEDGRFAVVAMLQ